MAIDHRAQSERVKNAMRDSGYEVTYHDGGAVNPAEPQKGYLSNSHNLHKAEERKKVKDKAEMDRTGRRLDYNGTTKIV